MTDFKLPIHKILPFISYDSLFILVTFIFVAWVLYKVFLKKITEKRHENLRGRFRTIYSNLIITIGMVIIHWFLVKSDYLGFYNEKISNILAFLAFSLVLFIVIKLSQVYVYTYLFWANMSQGVPRLIANIFTLGFATVLLSWVAAEVFAFNIATVLATSAIFTIVLGLALQDTLGNLFSGVALQMERPFNIGDWVEIHNANEHWVGQIQEVTWRATSLTGFGEELIIIPNKLIAQSQLIVFSSNTRPARFHQEFKFKMDVDVEAAKEAIYEILRAIPEITHDPAPRVLLTSITEQWILVKTFYSVKDYGLKNIVGDKVNTFVLENIKSKQIMLASPRLAITQEN